MIAVPIAAKSPGPANALASARRIGRVEWLAMKLRQQRALESAAHRVRRDEPDVGHAPNTLYGRHEVEMRLTHGFGSLVSRSEERHVEQQALVRHEPGVGIPEIRESSNEPARAGQQHDRQRDFGHGHRHEPARRAAAGARRA